MKHSRSNWAYGCRIIALNVNLRIFCALLYQKSLTFKIQSPKLTLAPQLLPINRNVFCPQDGLISVVSRPPYVNPWSNAD